MSQTCQYDPGPPLSPRFLDIKMIGIDPRVGSQFGPKNIQNGTNNNSESEITFDNIITFKNNIQEGLYYL